VDNNTQHSNISEEEMGQLHSLHLSMNAIAAVRRNMPVGASRLDCADCGESIPLARRIAAKGCIRCMTCQTLYEVTNA
jgi:phage/conjugal plasmid C-4 type zinc finger TraR family protein